PKGLHWWRRLPSLSVLAVERAPDISRTRCRRAIALLVYGQWRSRCVLAGASYGKPVRHPSKEPRIPWHTPLVHSLLRPFRLSTTRSRSTPTSRPLWGRSV